MSFASIVCEMISMPIPDPLISMRSSFLRFFCSFFFRFFFALLLTPFSSFVVVLSEPSA